MDQNFKCLTSMQLKAFYFWPMPSNFLPTDNQYYFLHLSSDNFLHEASVIYGRYFYVANGKSDKQTQQDWHKRQGEREDTNINGNEKKGHNLGDTERF